MTKEKEKKEQQLKTNSNKIDQFTQEFDYYDSNSLRERAKWKEIYDFYEADTMETGNPYASNLALLSLFSSVELFTAFLVGFRQQISVKPKEKQGTPSADLWEKFLTSQWEWILKGREKIITWVKQGILFGTGVLKLNWVDDKKEKYDDPALEVLNLDQFYTDYYYRNIQESPSVIVKYIKNYDDIKNDEKFKELEGFKEFLIADLTDLGGKTETEKKGVKKVEIAERWTKETTEYYVKKKGQESDWYFLKEEKNENGFLPFVVFRPILPPLKNRFYGISSLIKSLKLLTAKNLLINQMVDNITLVNQKMYIVRKGANINPMDLVARPGGIIKATNISNDIRVLETSDVKNSIEYLYKKIDDEFQTGSLMTNLMRGLPGAEFATEIAIQQKNVMVLLSLIRENLNASFRELGQKLLRINQENITTNKIIKYKETEKEIQWLEVSPEELKGEFEVEIISDQTASQDKALLQKQLLDFLSIISKDPQAVQKVDLMKIYKKWLELTGFSDVDYFFKEVPLLPAQSLTASTGMPTGREVLPPGSGNITPEQMMATARATARAPSSPNIPTI